MKIKLQDYSLISNEWIDAKIKEIEVFTHENWTLELELLKMLKQQLIPSEKLADVCVKKGRHLEKYYNQTHTEKFKDVFQQEFLTSEIEI